MSDRLLDSYDALLLDLDGTVYRGGQAVLGAAEAVDTAHRAGVTIRFVTNNASRGPAEVAAQLTDLGIPARPAEVSTSAQAAASVLAERVPAGAEIMVVGTEALVEEVVAVGLRPVREVDGDVAAVVQGLSKDAGWRDLAEACVAIRAGALWVACNIDPTLPTERGQLPGNGALVAALRTATGREPIVAGKPARPLMDQSVRSADARRPLVVGDRLDTDIAGAAAAELDALLVLTGVTTPADLLIAELRPRYVAADLTELTRPRADLEIADRPEWGVEPNGRSLTVRWRGGRSMPDPVALLRALCAAHRPERETAVDLVAADDTADTALAELGLRNRLA
jgi:glycerol 3-phosphatase-2